MYANATKYYACTIVCCFYKIQCRFTPIAYHIVIVPFLCIGYTSCSVVERSRHLLKSSFLLCFRRVQNRATKVEISQLISQNKYMSLIAMK